MGKQLHTILGVLQAVKIENNEHKNVEQTFKITFETLLNKIDALKELRFENINSINVLRPSYVDCLSM